MSKSTFVVIVLLLLIPAGVGVGVYTGQLLFVGFAVGIVATLASAFTIYRIEQPDETPEARNDRIENEVLEE